MSELAKRVGFAIPAAALFIWIVWLGGWYFKVVIFGIAFFAVFEMILLFNKNDFPVDGFFPFTFGLWVLLFPELPHAPQIGIAIFILFIMMQLFRRPDSIAKTYSSTLFCGIYAPLGFATLLLLRSGGSEMEGFLLVLAVLLMIWGNDVFAYFGGKWFGSHRLAPEISPKKTWEGFWIGFVGAFAGLSIPLWLLPFEFPLSLKQALPIIAIISLLGPVGDLAISKLKREAGVKDTSNIMPGHGGVLDRFDALILAVPGVYLYLFGLKVLGCVSF